MNFDFLVHNLGGGRVLDVTVQMELLRIGKKIRLFNTVISLLRTDARDDEEVLAVAVDKAVSIGKNFPVPICGEGTGLLLCHDVGELNARVLCVCAWVLYFVSNSLNARSSRPRGVCDK